MTIANQLAYLHGTKVALRDAMIEKGLDVPFGTPFSAYAALIESLNCSGGSVGLDFFGDGSGVINVSFDKDIGELELLTGTLPAINGMATFNGSSGLGVVLPEGLLAGDFSFSFYMKIEPAYFNAGLLSVGVYNQGTGAVSVYGGRVYGGNADQVAGGLPANTFGVFRHVTVVVTGGNLTTFIVDGEVITSGQSAAWNTANKVLYIGAGSGGSFGFYGSIKNLRVFDRAVTTTEALQLSQEAR